ncbi:hypothetical protein [Flavobacterium sp. AG291]|uniref:hypothetical protein n=1 Tax=Flavobacterium sp. AG291 TaxID=2184000 RepID=UPI000E0B01A6|nr:hypothetical protein [Flavobacterium sp. AG291]RDI08255.1 universal stress protein family protein [Flavobacterium sp. AG291]
MKNILIPTTLQHDTLFAVKTALKQANSNCNITIMYVRDVADAESASLFLRSARPSKTDLQAKILEACHSEANNYPHCTLELHNRYGISAPLLKNLLQHLNTDFIIVPASYRQERDSIHHYCLNLLSNSKISMLHLTEAGEELEFNKALYLEHSSAQLDIQQLQELVGNRFNLRIVSHASLAENYPEQLEQQLNDAIAKNNIDLLIETRKTEKIRMKKRKEAYVNETLGLPVLSIFEEV